MQNKKIITVILDWTLKQPVEVKLPKECAILKILYVNKYDHLYVSADISQPKELRKFICRKTNDIIEDCHNYEYITSTVDEENEVWHIFEVVEKKLRTQTTRKSKSEQWKIVYAKQISTK